MVVSQNEIIINSPATMPSVLLPNNPVSIPVASSSNELNINDIWNRVVGNQNNNNSFTYNPNFIPQMNYNGVEFNHNENNQSEPMPFDFNSGCDLSIDSELMKDIEREKIEREKREEQRLKKMEEERLIIEERQREMEELRRRIIEERKENKIINANRTNIDAQEARQLECCICWENLPNILFLPCQHMTLCSECKNLYDKDECPLCKQEIKQMIAVHHN